MSTNNIAPENLSPEQLGKSQLTKTPDLSAYRGPNTLVVGCGGCGINLARLVATETGANTLLVDTGVANTRPGENVFIIGDGDGSGGVQDKNAENTVKQIPTIDPDTMGKTDIAIVCFSLSGGSGSFIGPYVIKTFLARGIQCIAFALMDSGSVMQAKNTITALGNLDALSTKAGVTLPMMAFDNKTLPRETMNAVIRNKGRVLLRLLTDPTMEVDRNDRRHFLDGTVTHEAKAGLRLINVLEGGQKEVENQPIFPNKDADIFDAILHIRGDKDGVLIDYPHIPELTQFRKDGHFIGSAIPVLGLISPDLSVMNGPLKKIADLQERVATHAKLGTGGGMALPSNPKAKTSKFF